MSHTQGRIIAAVIAALAAMLMAVQATNAAFTAQTSNAANSLAAGTVELTDNDGDSAMFAVTDMVPGQTETACIEVTYSGSVDSEVRVFGAATGTGLDAYLDLTIERGTGDCTTFGDATAFWTGTNGDLGDFLGSATDFASGSDAWQPTGGAPDDTVPYRFTMTLQDDNNAQGLATSITFTWEAQNR